MMHSTVCPTHNTAAAFSPVRLTQRAVGAAPAALAGACSTGLLRTAVSEHQPQTARRRRALLRGARKLPQQLGAVANGRHGMPRPRLEAAQGGNLTRG